MTLKEQEVTPFGTMTSDRLIYNVQRNWITEGFQKEIALRDITSVKVEIKRHQFFGILFLLVTIACRAFDSIGTLIAIAPLSLAVLLLWGLPTVKVQTDDDGEFQSIPGPPWSRPEAEWFVAAVDGRRHQFSANTALTAVRSVHNTAR
jgi:hypothetical protein